jgi:hypothetical protein
MSRIDSQISVELPESLRQQFARLEARLWRVETLGAICLASSALLVSFLALFISDRFWETPTWLRVALSGAGGVALVWLLFGWLKQWVFQRRDDRALAVLVQQQHRRLGDRLLGIVELADERQRPEHFSPALYRAAIDQVANEAINIDFTSAVRPRPVRAAALGLLALAALTLLPALLFPGAAWNALERWIAPISAIQRLTLVSLDGLPRELIVPQGEPFELGFAARYRSFWHPHLAMGQVERQPRLLALGHGQRLELRVPGQTREGKLRIRLGDARAEVALHPVYRPSLKELTASIELPAYLQYPATRVSAESGGLDVLEGSRVSFQGRASHPLDSAQLQLTEQDPVKAVVREDAFSTDPLVLDAVAEVGFIWRDRFGLTNSTPWRLQVRSEKDQAPIPEIADLQRDSAILQSEVLDLHAVGRDDFGVKEVGVNWQLVSDAESTNRASTHYVFPASTPHEKKLEDVFHFSPGLLKVPPDSTVELQAWATDFLPGRAPSQSPVYRLHVLGNESHAELVRQNLESLLSHLEEVTRLEEKLAATTRSLKDLPKEKAAANETTDKIAGAKQDQTQNAANLDELAKEGKQTLREAFRNPTFSEETLRDWTKTLQSMQQLSEDAMAQAAKSLQSAQQNPPSRPEDLQKALQKEQEILEALEDMQRKVNKGLDQLQALTLAQRLRKLSSDEKGIAGRLQRIVPDTIGLLPKELASGYQKTESALADDQGGAQKDAQVLHGEIGRFFERTQKENYGKVSKQMTDSHLTDELDHVRGLIQENISMDATHSLAEWSDRLNAWADLLQPKSDSSGGGGEGGAGGEDEALMRELLGLLRVRDREVNLRQRTGLLDQAKPDAATYHDAAKALASTQTEIKNATSKIQQENPAPALEAPLQDIVDSMQGVQALLDKPQTGRETELAQNRSVDLLSDVINLLNEQQQRGNSSSNPQKTASAEEMAFLMQMMAQQMQPAFRMGLNPKGGGSLAGGTTDRAATGLPGDPTGKAPEPRTSRGASGASENVPTEFREALEKYYKAVEKLDQK